MSQLYLSATHKSSGKTTLCLGIGRALSRRGLKVQAFKKGPDYIDPIWHGRATGRPCYNLDFRLMREDEIVALHRRHAADADLGLVEGNMGLFDGMDPGGRDSNAAMARRLGLPVLLVLDCTGMTRGAAPLLLGYQAFDPGLRIAGVILNKVAGERHESKLRAVIEQYTDLPVLGALHRDPGLSIVERHLGLIPGNESLEAEARIDAIAAAVEAQVDLDALLRAGQDVRLPRAEGRAASLRPAFTGPQRLRLAYARDRAFGFHYAEDLDTLRDAGVELRPFDTLRDARLPDADGLWLGGGFPESFMTELEANQSLRADLHARITAGLPTYAECGGLMYLCRQLRWGGRSAAMVGVVPADAVMTDQAVGRGYASLRLSGAHPLAEPEGAVVAAHEFHHSGLQALAPGLTHAYTVERGHGIDGRNDGIVLGNLLAAYCHRRGSGEHGWIGPFIAEMQRWRIKNTSLAEPSSSALLS